MTIPNSSAAQAGVEAEKAPLWKTYAASSIGIEMALYVVLGYFGGAWLDSQLGTTPLFMLLLVIIGVAFGIVVMIRASRSAWGMGSAATSSVPEASKGQR